MCSAPSRAGQPVKARSAADRLCLGLAGVNLAKAVTEPDRRRSLDSRPNCRLRRAADSSAASSHPPDRDHSMNPLAKHDSKTVRMTNSGKVSAVSSSEVSYSTEVTSSEARPAPTVWVGIDVAKATLDLHVRPSGLACQLANTTEGHRAILKQLPKAGECLIVLEATGGYERALVAELLEAGHHVAVMNPKRIRDFAKALGTLAKTDRLDAQVLALFAEKIAPPTAVKPRENQTARQELVNRRRQLIDLRTVEKNRWQTTLSPLSQQYQGGAEAARQAGQPPRSRDRKAQSRADRPPRRTRAPQQRQRKIDTPRRSRQASTRGGNPHAPHPKNTGIGQASGGPQISQISTDSDREQDSCGQL